MACLAASVLAAVAAISALATTSAQGGSGALVLAVVATAAALLACFLAAMAWRDAALAERRRSAATRENQAQARVLSHEIRTPLAIITGSAELLAGDSVALNPEQRGFLRAILSNTRTLQRLVEDLLTQARIDAGLFSMRPETVDFRELVAEVVDELRPLYQVEILLGNLRAPLVVSLDPVLFRQVLNNLVSNCARYSSEIAGADPGDPAGERRADRGLGFRPRDRPLAQDGAHSAPREQRDRPAGGPVDPRTARRRALPGQHPGPRHHRELLPSERP